MSTPKLARYSDTSLISLDNQFEIGYLQERVGVSRDQILAAIAAVGNGRREVVAALERMKRTPNASPAKQNAPATNRKKDAAMVSHS